MKEFSLVVCLLLSQFVTVANASDVKGFETLLGKSIYDGVAQLHLKLGEYFVVDEPPCVPRGIRGQSVSEVKITLFVQRGDVPFRKTCKWTLDEFANKRIIGIMQRVEDKVYIYGEVPVAWRLVR